MEKLYEKVKDAVGEVLTEENITALADLVKDALMEQKIALSEAHAEEIARIDEDAKQAITEVHERTKAEAEARIDECVELAVEEILQEHEARLVETDKFERMQAVFESVKEAFELNGFALDAEAWKLHEEREQMASDQQYATLFEKYSKLKDELQEAAEELDLAKRSIIFESMTRDVPLTVRTRVGELIENVKFDSIDEFREGLQMIIEANSQKAEGEDKDDDEEGEAEETDNKKKVNESRITRPAKPLYEMTSEERMAYYKGQL